MDDDHLLGPLKKIENLFVEYFKYFIQKNILLW